jgi:hypothetical protein
MVTGDRKCRIQSWVTVPQGYGEHVPAQLVGCFVIVFLVLMTPLTMLVLSGLINDYLEGGFSIPNDIVDKVCTVTNGD